MSAPPTYWVYVLANRSGTLYVGVTNDLERRMNPSWRDLRAERSTTPPLL